MSKKQVVLVDLSGSAAIAREGVVSLSNVALDATKEIAAKNPDTYVYAIGDSQGPRVIAGPHLTEDMIARNYEQAANQGAVWGSEFAPSVDGLASRVGFDEPFNLVLVTDGDVSDKDATRDSLRDLLQIHPGNSVHCVIANNDKRPTQADAMMKEVGGGDRVVRHRLGRTDEAALKDTIKDAAGAGEQSKWNAFAAERAGDKGAQHDWTKVVGDRAAQGGDRGR